MAHGHEPLMSIALEVAPKGPHLSKKVVKNEGVSYALWPHDTQTEETASGSISHGHRTDHSERDPYLKSFHLMPTSVEKKTPLPKLCESSRQTYFTPQA